MGEKKPDRFTITFYNKFDLDETEVRDMFGEVGRILGMSYINGRFFIRYGNKDEAEEALNRFRDKYQADFARERGERSGGGGGGGAGDRSDRNDSRNDRGRSRRIEPNDDSRPSFQGQRSLEDESSSSRKALVPVKNIPELIDSTTKAPEKFLFVIGNLPPKFTQEDVLNLIAEINPLHVGKIDNTPELNLSFCPIHLETIEKVKYLYEKLDFFVVGGHKLIAMEASQLLEEAELGAS